MVSFSVMRISVCMVSDFFLPGVGGVETHIYQLSHALSLRGHHVVIITHAYGNRKGVRYLSNGVKVYYLGVQPFHEQVTFPTVYATMPLLRSIWLREATQVVHGHQTHSTLAHEALLHAATLGLHTCFTDHSLFGFADCSTITVNKVLHFAMANVEGVICVSHTCRANTCLRTGLSPHKIWVIPNAIDLAAEFSAPVPRSHGAGEGRVMVAVVSRLAYRKGVDLLLHLIPQVCAEIPTVDFLIAGSGPRALDIEEMRDHHGLEGRVTLLGDVPHHAIASRVLQRSHVLLSCSLTEAFGMASLEAAAAGLVVVATAVGGVREVLPPCAAILSPPTVSALLAALREAVDRARSPPQQPNAVTDAYRWSDVATRTECVYTSLLSHPPPLPADRLLALYSLGRVAGKLFLMVAVVDYFLAWLLDLLCPAPLTDPAPRIPVPMPDQDPSD